MTCFLYTVYNPLGTQRRRGWKVLSYLADQQATEHRMERDFLGTRAVPAQAYYGIQTVRAMENFPITGLCVHRRLIRSLALVKQAAAYANLTTGHLEPRLAEAIIQAAAEVAAGDFSREFVVDPVQGGAGTSINMNANEVIANRAIEILGGTKGDYSLVSPNSHVNMSQSTNDVLPTAVHLAVLSMYPDLKAAIGRLIAAFGAKGREFGDTVKVGRTHLQDAVSISFGQVFHAYSSALGRAQQFLQHSAEALYEVNIGGTAVGTGLNADNKYRALVLAKLRELSGLPLVPAADLVDSTQNVDRLVRVSAELKALALVLSKIANDLRLMNSGPKAGIKEISLPDVQPGSSIMPGKVNPVIAEMVNQVAFQVIGNDMTITMVAEAGQFELNVMQPVAVFNLLQSMEILTRAIGIFAARAVSGIKVHADRCRAMADNNVSLVTALVPVIGYEKASALAKRALLSGQPIGEFLRDATDLAPEVIEHICTHEPGHPV